MSRHKRWAARVMIMALTAVNPVIALADMEVPALDVTAETGQSEGINISENTENLQENSQNQGSPVIEAGSKELQEAVGEGAAAETPASPESTQGMTAENTAGVSESLPPSESMAADTSGSSPVMTAGSGSSPVIGPGTNADPGAGQSAQNLPRIRQRHFTLPLAVGRGHHNRLHIGCLNLFLVPIQPAGVQKLIHITADPEPFYSCGKYDAVRILHRLWKRGDLIFVLKNIDSLYRDA